MAVDEKKKVLLLWLDENTARFTKMADQIWENPEIYWEEVFASGLLADYFESEGFSVTHNPPTVSKPFSGGWEGAKPFLPLSASMAHCPELCR